MASLFKSERGKQEILALYNQKLEELGILYESKLIETSFGTTHLIVTGDPANPPLFIVHGSNGCAPIGLECYPNLSSRFQVFAVDVLAQPNKSAETRLSMKNHSYGEWLNELMEALHLNDVRLLGFSFGGLIILKTLIAHPERVREVFLASPAYIVNGNPLKALFKVFLPMRRFMRSLDGRFIEKFLAEIFSERDPFAVQFLSKVFQHFEMDFTPVPVISKQEAQRIKTPITLIAAGQDIMFPGRKMLKRAKKLFSSLKDTILLEESRHVQNQQHNLLVEQLVFKSMEEKIL